MRQIVIIILICSLLLPLATFCSACENQVLSSGWKVQIGDPADAAGPDFNDAGWQAVSLPHNWGWEDAQAGKELLSRAGLVSAANWSRAQPAKDIFCGSRRRAWWPMFI